MGKLDINSKLPLNSGYTIPVLGFGVYQTPKDQADGAVADALNAGYRHIDSALMYHNEEACGAAVKASSIPRGDIFFTSKIFNRHFTPGIAAEQIDQTLANSGLEYLDLLLIHAPFGGPAARKAAWNALVDAQEAGKVRSIGVSNYGVHHLDELEAHIKDLEEERGKGRGGVISVGQWEIHPWLPHPDIVEWCEKRGVVVEAYSPLVRGQRKDDPVLAALAKKHGKTWAQILVRWSLQRGYVPLPKSATATRIEENAKVYDFELDAEDMKSLETGVNKPCAWDPTVEGLEK